MWKLGTTLLRMDLWYKPFGKRNGVDGQLATCMNDISNIFAIAVHRQQLLAVAWTFGIAATNAAMRGTMARR